MYICICYIYIYTYTYIIIYKVLYAYPAYMLELIRVCKIMHFYMYVFAHICICLHVWMRHIQQNGEVMGKYTNNRPTKMERSGDLMI